jgi:hypothetical protein
MSSSAPFSGLIEMPQTELPASATDEDVADTESGGTSSSGGFKSFWENHQMIMMVIGLGVLLLTAVLVFRKSNASSNATNNSTPAGGGIPTVQTSDTSNAINQQNTSIEALLNAFQQFANNTTTAIQSIGGNNTPTPTTTPTPTPTPTPSGTPPSTTPWWYNLLTGGPNASPGQHTYYVVPQNMTLNQISDRFGISWPGIAYNPNNQGALGGKLLSYSYSAKGGNIIPAGTALWIPTSTLASSAPTVGSSTSGLSAQQSTMYGTGDASHTQVSNIGS